MFTLSIVIPTYNGQRHLERCLPSVCRHAPPGTQILVVDDASSDGTASWVRENFPNVELIVLPANLGFVGAVNTGLGRAGGDVIELLNNDTEVCAGWVEPCLSWFQDPTIGSVAPLVLQMDRPEVIDSAGMDYHLCGWAYNRGLNRRMGPAYEGPCEVFGPSGAAGFYRRTALQKTGFLVPEFGAYFEDTDLAFRLRWAGFRCIYEPRARVLHQGTATYGKESDRLTRLISRNEELVFWMNLPLPKLLLGLVPHAGFLAIRLARKLFTRKLGPFLEGKQQALAGWRTILERRRQVRGLATGRQASVNLFLSHTPNIIGHGCNWLRRRQCA
jgi:GT2 family glycosyltransferase